MNRSDYICGSRLPFIFCGSCGGVGRCDLWCMVGLLGQQVKTIPTTDRFEDWDESARGMLDEAFEDPNFTVVTYDFGKPNE